VQPCSRCGKPCTRRLTDGKLMHPACNRQKRFNTPSWKAQQQQLQLQEEEEGEEEQKENQMHAAAHLPAPAVTAAAIAQPVAPAAHSMPPANDPYRASVLTHVHVLASS
jgi:uncharacterized Zn finger protein (UPF0148 family)